MIERNHNSQEQTTLKLTTLLGSALLNAMQQIGSKHTQAKA